MMILESQLPLQIKKCHVHIKNDVSCTWELLDMLIFNYLFLMFGSSYILVIYIFVFFYFSSLFHVFYFYCYWHFNFILFAILETSLISMFGCYINGYLIFCVFTLATIFLQVDVCNLIRDASFKDLHQLQVLGYACYLS